MWSPPPTKTASAFGRPTSAPGPAREYPRADAVAFGVAADLLALGGVRFDRDHPGAEPRALHRHRTRARADVPDRPAGSRAEAGQHQCADLRLGDHRVAVLERVLGQRPAVRGARVAGQPARRGCVFCSCSCSCSSRLMRMLGSARPVCAGRTADLLLGGAEELDRVDALARGVQVPRQAGGGARRGQDGCLGVRQRGGQGFSRVAAVGRDDQGVVPVQADSREGVRDRGDRRDDVRRDPAGAQGPDDAEEAGVAGGEDGGGAFACGDGVEGLVQVPEL